MRRILSSTNSQMLPIACYRNLFRICYRNPLSLWDQRCLLSVPKRKIKYGAYGCKCNTISSCSDLIFISLYIPSFYGWSWFSVCMLSLRLKNPAFGCDLTASQLVFILNTFCATVLTERIVFGKYICLKIMYFI